jgi:hypothetical protein
MRDGYFDLDPPSRRATAIGRLRILRDEPLVTALLDDRPGGEPVIQQAPRRVDHAGAVHLSLEHVPTAMEWEAANIERMDVHALVDASSTGPIRAPRISYAGPQFRAASACTRISNTGAKTVVSWR